MAVGRTDEAMMMRALTLARRGEGGTRPNPPVGAVVVHDGHVVGEGYHQVAGGPHAEVFALRRAGAAARGATLYVSLEPCSTHGRTPPCCEAILAAGISRVVVSVQDPNPKHRGRGLRLLRRGGVSVTSGVMREEGNALLAPFRSLMERHRPYVTLKMAMTADGRIADVRGGSRWVTGPAARELVHALRRRVDAVLVGSGTAVADNPSLFPSRPRKLRPLRVVADSRGRLPLAAKVLTDGFASSTLIATTSAAPAAWRDAVSHTGAEVLPLQSRAGHVSLRRLLAELGRRGIMHLLCEGGGCLAGQLARLGVIDEFWFFLAPKLLLAGTPVMAGVGRTIGAALELDFLGAEMCGQDCLLRAHPRRPKE